MYYLLVVLLFIILYYTFVKVLSSLLKGCFMAVGLLFVIIVSFTFIKSAFTPVDIFGIYVIDNFKVLKQPAYENTIYR